MNSSQFSFAIVTPSYNQGGFIEQTIKSITSQKCKVEYWVMDGGSHDETKNILGKFGERINWVSEKDKGQADAINKGIAKIKTNQNQHQIFAYLNSDDYYLPGAFEAVAEAFERNPDRMWLVGDAMIVDQENQETHQVIRWYKKLWRLLMRLGVGEWPLKILNPFPQPAVFVRWEAVKKIGKFKEELVYTLDYDYWLRLHQKFGAPIFLSRALAIFRIHSSSKGETGFDEQFEEQLQVAKKFTSSELLLGLQKIHNFLITGVYRIIK